MLKHIGRHGDRKVVVAYNTVPGEDHMCLVIYSDSLPAMVHDEVMKVVESAAGQNSKVLAEALHRNIMPDGNNTLGTLHRGGWLKKVQTKQVILTPNAKTSVRLDELNDILKGMEAGEEAVKKMKAIDEGRGFADPAKSKGRDLGEPAKVEKKSVNTNEALSDTDLAQQRLDQAARMEAEAKGLLAEAKRLKEEAKTLVPTKAKNVRTTKTKKDTA